ncbi:MAG: carbon-nitrogen hydrolase family protein [Bryobacterales bacterium]|nr:carbon-nitrogen hydrolase family protein [Bryobacterales bacterium]
MPIRIALGMLLAALACAADLSFNLAGLSLMPEPWNKEANFAKLERYARQAAGRGAQVVITPEGFLEGYVGNEKHTPGLTRERYLPVGEAIDGPLMSRIRELARELKIYLAVGFAERDREKMYNSVAIFSPEGALASRYSKSHTADDEPFNTKGTEFPVVSTPFGRWGTLICFDRQLPETMRILAVKGAQFVLVPSWGGYGEMNDIMMRVRAYENSVWLAFVHPKRCLIIDPRGNIVASNSGEHDQIVTARIDPATAGRKGLIDRRRPELYGEILGKAK